MFEIHGSGKSVAVFKSETGQQEVTLTAKDSQIEVLVVLINGTAMKDVLDYKSEEEAAAAFNGIVKEARAWKVNQPDWPHDGDERPEPEKPKTTRKPRAKAEPKPE